MSTGRPWRDLAQVAMPTSMHHLPRDARGYPIPFNMAVSPTTGKPSFVTVDVEKARLCLREGLCAITGLKLESRFALVGGPVSMANRIFSDLPMRVEAARYALQVCPFLAAPVFAYRRVDEKVEGMVTDKNYLVSGDRPDVFGLGIVEAASPALLLGNLVVVAGEYVETEWWARGQQVDEPADWRSRRTVEFQV